MIPPSCLNILVREHFLFHQVGIFCVTCFGSCFVLLCWWEDTCLAHLNAPFSRLQVAPGFVFCCPDWRKAVPSHDHRILLALCWTPSCCFVFLLRAMSICESQISAGSWWVLIEREESLHWTAACAVLMWGWWLYSHVCYSPTRALSWLKHCCLPVFNYPSAHSLSCAGASTAVALWQARANQEAHPKLKQIKCILSDQLFFLHDSSKPWADPGKVDERRAGLLYSSSIALCSVVGQSVEMKAK